MGQWDKRYWNWPRKIIAAQIPDNMKQTNQEGKKNSQKSHTTLSLECSEYIELRRTQRKEYVKPLKKKKFAHLVFNYFFFCWTTESEHQTSKYNHYISSKSDWLQWVVPKLTDLRIQPICLKYRIFQKSRMRSHASLKTGNAKKKYNLTYGLV